LGDFERTMLSGFNTNFQYRGVLFHVQTEDSGIGNPHVITHLFHGGNIMASQKHDYSALLDDEDMETAVRKSMEGQHKTMLKQLLHGEHDAAIGQRLGPDIFSVDAEVESPASSVTEDAPPLVVAEQTRIGLDPSASDQVNDALILNPEFTDDASLAEPLYASDETDSEWPASRGSESPSAWASPSIREKVVSNSTVSATPENSTNESELPPAADAAPSKASRLSRVFGDRVVSEKPLDEVVMDYLVENARKRKRQPK
jgi:hypothetical protein